MAAATVVWKVAAVDPIDHTVLLPNPADCGSYFSCSNGVPIPMPCPDGLHFNAKLDVCDSPQNANCAGTRVQVTEVTKTNDAGWEWDVSLKIWKFGTQVSHNPPGKVTETTEVYYCCKRGEGASSPCNDINCKND
jgi:hypothetical protein